MTPNLFDIFYQMLDFNWTWFGNLLFPCTILFWKVDCVRNFIGIIGSDYIWVKIVVLCAWGHHAILQEFNSPHFFSHYEGFTTVMSVIFSSIYIIIWGDMPSKVRTVTHMVFRNKLIYNMFTEYSLSYMQTFKIK